MKHILAIAAALLVIIVALNLFNNVHSKSQDTTTIEEMNYTFYRDLQHTLHETREFNTKLFEQASAQVASL